MLDCFCYWCRFYASYLVLTKMITVGFFVLVLNKILCDSNSIKRFVTKGLRRLFSHSHIGIGISIVFIPKMSFLAYGNSECQFFLLWEWSRISEECLALKWYRINDCILSWIRFRLLYHLKLLNLWRMLLNA